MTTHHTRQDLRNRTPFHGQTYTMSRGYTPPAREASGWGKVAHAVCRACLVLAALAVGYSALLALSCGWLQLIGG